jgi:hypothetical protein
MIADYYPPLLRKRGFPSSSIGERWLSQIISSEKRSAVQALNEREVIVSTPPIFCLLGSMSR